jgi:hypothetical protein
MLCSRIKSTSLNKIQERNIDQVAVLVIIVTGPFFEGKMAVLNEINIEILSYYNKIRIVSYKKTSKSEFF